MDLTRRANIAVLTNRARALLAAIDQDGNRRLDEVVSDLQDVGPHCEDFFRRDHFRFFAKKHRKDRPLL